MIIDFHTHIFPEKIARKAMCGMSAQSRLLPFLNGTEDALIDSMKKSGVDLSIVLPVATNPLKCESMNEFALALNEKYSNAKCTEPRILSFAAIHPAAPNAKQLIKQIAADGFKGIKIHPDYQGVYFDDARVKSLIEEAESFNLVTVTHAGVDYGFISDVHCSPERVLSLVNDVHPQKLVLAHLGGNSLWYDVDKILCNLGLYFDTAFVNTRISKEMFLQIVNHNSAEKILFATDSPWNDQKDDAEFIKNLPLDDATKEKILSANAKMLLGI